MMPPEGKLNNLLHFQEYLNILKSEDIWYSFSDLWILLLGGREGFIFSIPGGWNESAGSELLF